MGVYFFVSAIGPRTTLPTSSSKLFSNHLNKCRFFPRQSPTPSSYHHSTIATQVTMSTTNGSACRILVPVGNGSEEIETSSAVDVFRRVGADVTLASVESDLNVTMSRGMKFVADTTMDSIEGPFDAIALPGGMPGAERLRDCTKLIDLLKESQKNGKIIAAVCASPAVVLAKHGIVDRNTKATCYPHPKFRDMVEKLESDVDVVVDGNVITGTGPGTAIKWALAIVEALYGKEKADKLAAELLAVR